MAQEPPIPLEVFVTRHSGRPAVTGQRGGHRPPGPLRVAFLGRTSTEDQQDPTLSIPRQLANCRQALPAEAVIAAHFYDIESGRKELAARGQGRGHERFVIPVPREGGIRDLLTEAETSDRRFDAVICESIDRIARRTYIGTQIENQLEAVGVPLLAADEPIILNNRKRATQVLTRRVKQGVAEWYVLELLEKSRGGTETHTQQGYNIGKPPYGYTALKVPHPVAARRAEGATKHRLTPDPVRGEVVTLIFDLRVALRLGYKAIADHLNLDLDRFPPPVPVDPSRSAGRWTQSSVREIIKNPKYTGYMVWNRRATKTASGRINPPHEWVWSLVPTHEPLVSKDNFIAAQRVGDHCKGSRNGGGPNTAHPDTRREYLLRSHIACDHCGRRLRGRAHHGVVYYVCDPPKDRIPAGHPKSYWIREDPILRGIGHFFDKYVFHPNRRAYVGSLLNAADEQAVQDHEDRITAVQRTLRDIEDRRKRLIVSLELADQPNEALVRDVNLRSAELAEQHAAKHQELRTLRETQPPRANPELLDRLPVGNVAFGSLPQKIQRGLLDVFNVEMRYNPNTGRMHAKATLTGPILPTLQEAAQLAIDAAQATKGGGDPVIMDPWSAYPLPAATFRGNRAPRLRVAMTSANSG
ncbi:recombinase family protein [Actinomadura rupiterrae]|uniref:recombinase family protein n=1 Tax=Actinomadura rupiterrae TaxID=559627 RepID=UPI0020A2836D|nr:recombinase family protein [Actinomadura rupiterrae]MCP2337551.1 DNA invertase Pin-like site-specific DNA recombinase [Actinomadura rupiterrae]